MVAFARLLITSLTALLSIACLGQNTFNVDMSCPDTRNGAQSFENVFVSGTWCNWCGNIGNNELTDPDGDGVYSVTIDLSGNGIDYVEYVYGIDDFLDSENLVDDMVDGAVCAPITDYSNYANRTVEIGGVANDIFGHCQSCPTGVPAMHDVTFNVNTANIEVGPNGLFAGAGLLGGSNAHAMSEVSEDLWTLTLPLEEGTTGNYIFFNSPSGAED